MTAAPPSPLVSPSATAPGSASGAAALDVVVMAAGKGTRMKSRKPKVLQRLAGRPLLWHVLDQAASLSARRVVVVTGHGAMEVEASTAGAAGAGGSFDLQFVRQEPQLGTGHAVQQAVPALAGDGTVVVLSGDVPLTRADTLAALVAASRPDRLALLTVTLPDPTGYGRIVRGADGAVQGIVEHKDASDAERAIDEVYSGIMAVPARLLAAWLARLSNDNAQGEYYLTDIVAMAVAGGVPVAAHRIADALQVAGVNSPLQLAELERAHQLRQAQALMEQGVRLADPARFDVRDDARSGARGQLVCGQDVEIDVNCVFTGRVELGEGVQIGANCCIANAAIAAGAVIHPFTHIDGEKAGAAVGAGALIGPFARLRPGAQLGRDVHIGNFVEVKNSTLADGAKANHLAYLGDATVGERVNYGAGSITANYDGANKHRTVIEADVHIGSNCVLVAPVTIGAGGTVGAGSTIAKSTPPGALSVVRGKQIVKDPWQRPAKQPPAPPGMTDAGRTEPTGLPADAAAAGGGLDASALRALLAERDRALSDARAAQEEFLRAVSHDLRAPLRHITSYTPLVRELVEDDVQGLQGEARAEAGSFLDTLDQAARRMGRMLDGLLALSRIAQAPLERAPVDLGAVVADVRRTLTGAAPGRGIDWQVAPALPIVVGDAALLGLLLAEVLGNAVKFTRDRAPARIEVGGGTAADGTAWLSVRDNGTGFDPARAGALFGVFQRLHRDADFDGMGVGLAKARAVMQRHAGHIGITAVPGEGCTVELRWPAALAVPA